MCAIPSSSKGKDADADTDQHLFKKIKRYIIPTMHRLELELSISIG